MTPGDDSNIQEKNEGGQKRQILFFFFFEFFGKYECSKQDL